MAKTPNPFGNLPTVTIPPPPPSASKKKPGLNEFYAKYPGVAQWKVMIAQWSRTYGVDPLQVAAVIAHETHGSNTPPGGVAQITSSPPYPPQEFLTTTTGFGTTLNPMDPNESIAYLAWSIYKSGYNGDVEGFYQHVWNPRYVPGPNGTSPKELSPGQIAAPFQAGVPTPPATPAQKAAGAAAAASAKGAVPYNLDKLRYHYYDQLVALAEGKQYTPQQAKVLANQVLKTVAAQKYPPGEEYIHLQSALQIAMSGFKATLTQGEIKAKYESQMMQRAIAAGYAIPDARRLVAQAISQTAKAQLPPDQIGQFLTGQYALDAATLAAQLKAQKSLQASQLSQLKRTTTEYAPTFLAYAGRLPTVSEIQNIIDAGTSKYQVAASLMKQSGFQKSPIWLQNVDRYQAYYQSVFGTNAKPPAEAIQYAILHSLDETAFKNMLQHDQLPDQPKYTTSEEYKGLYATYQSAYSNIYGLPDEVGRDMIEQAIKKGWTADQWTQYLRKQPEYTSSGEYQARAMDLASRMGLIQAPQQTLVSPVAHPTEQMQDALQGQPQGNPTPPQVSPVPVGEPKNQPPFTRPVGR